MEMHQQRLFDPFVLVRPAVTQRGLINKGTEDVAKRDNHARLIALLLKQLLHRLHVRYHLREQVFRHGVTVHPGNTHYHAQ